MTRWPQPLSPRAVIPKTSRMGGGWFFNIDMAVLRSSFEASEELTACINRAATESHRGARQKGHTPASQHLVPRDKEADFPHLIISGVK